MQQCGWDDHTKWNKSEEERQIPYDITYMWNPPYDTNEFYKTEMNSQTQRSDLRLPRGQAGEAWSVSLGLADANYFI